MADEGHEQADADKAADEDAALDEDDEFDRLYERKGALFRLTKQLGGAVTGIAIEGGYAYLGKGYRMLVLDLADPAHPVVVGYTPTLDQMTEQVFIQGTLAVVVTYRSVYLFDVSEPGSPAQLSQIPFYAEPGSVRFDFPYMHVADATDEGEGITVTFDLSDPAHPARVGMAPGGPLDHLQTKRIKGKASNSADHTLVVYDPHSELEPHSVDVADLAETIAAAVHVGPYAYFPAEDGLHVFDCADAAHPVPCYYFMTGGSVIQVVVIGQIACVVCYGVGLYTFDIREPSTPLPLAHFGYPRYVEEADAHGGYLYLPNSGLLSSYDTDRVAEGFHEHGLLVLDVRDPRRPVGTVVDLGLYHAQAVAVSDNRAYVIDGDDAYAVLRSLDLTRDCDLGERSWIALGQRALAIAASGPMAYVAMQGGLVTFDFNDLECPVQCGFYTTTSAVTAMALDRRAIYLTDTDGLHVISIANPSRPRRLAHLPLDATPIDVVVANGLILVLMEKELRLVTRRGQQFTTHGRWEPPVDDSFDSVAIYRTAAVIAGDGDFWVVDIQDPSQPCLIARISETAMTEDVIAAGSYVLGRNYDNLYALDLTDPYRPVLANDLVTWDFPELTPQQLATDGDRCYAACAEAGLLEIELGAGDREAAD